MHVLSIIQFTIFFKEFCDYFKHVHLITDFYGKIASTNNLKSLKKDSEIAVKKAWSQFQSSFYAQMRLKPNRVNLFSQAKHRGRSSLPTLIIHENKSFTYDKLTKFYL